MHKNRVRDDRTTRVPIAPGGRAAATIKRGAVFDIEVSGHEKVPPTPDILDALERDYPLEASVADLVDNSLDAKAKNVLIRFLRKGPKLVSLCIADDGRGITEGDANRAMGFAARRDYAPSDLGMFGVGLKTASLSQADTVIVVSHSRGSGAVGRQWTKAGIKERDWSLDTLKTSSAVALLQHEWGAIGRIPVGTVVQWNRVYDFERLRVGVDAYLERAKLRIQNHLGLKLYRFLSRRQIKIQIDVEDIDSGEVGPPSQVTPMNPFPPKEANGSRGFPKVFVVRFPGGGGKVTMRAHIWRKKSGDEGYKLGGGKVAEHQGFYFFRHDRLIQDGGWCGLIGTNEPHLSLARVEVDMPDALSGYLKVQSNKTRVDVPATFAEAVLAARAKDGSHFRDYVDSAEEVYRRRGEQKARPMLQPGDGIPAEVRKTLEKKSMRFHRAGKCSVIWKSIGGTNFIHIDQDNRQIVLNKRYREILLRGQHGGKTDVPLLRTLLYFVFESMLAGDRIGSVERLRLEAIQACMNAALKLEKQWATD